MTEGFRGEIRDETGAIVWENDDLGMVSGAWDLLGEKWEKSVLEIRETARGLRVATWRDLHGSTLRMVLRVIDLCQVENEITSGVTPSRDNICSKGRRREIQNKKKND